MPLRKDIWRPAIVAAPMADVLAAGTLDGLKLRWLPESGSFRFLADPFGLWRDDLLHVFVEAFDYRTRRGVIDVLVYDSALVLKARKTVLTKPWHLSYPFVFEAEGDIWMLPEAYRSGRLTLYRAVDFPWRWEPAHVLDLKRIAVDATPLFHHGLWYLFHAKPARSGARTGHLHLSVAEHLSGPWHDHPSSPIVRNHPSCRPGGTPLSIDDRIILPVQDGARTYGGAIRPLTIEGLSPDRLVAHIGDPIVAPASAAPYVEGLHTMAAVGDFTLIDVKRTELSLHGLSIEAGRELRRLTSREADRAARVR